MTGGETGYGPSDVTTINLVADVDVLGISLNIQASEGAAQDPRYMAPSLTDLSSLGTIVNADELLITGISGSVPFGAPAVPAGQVLYSFEFHWENYHYPELYDIYIDDITDASAIPPLMTSIMASDYSFITDVEPIGVPEPATIGLLGLGALGLLRRRK